MNCAKCSVSNDQDALFCKNCGTAFYPEKQTRKKDYKVFDILLFVSIAYWFVMDLINLTIRNFVENWYEGPIKYLQIGASLIYAVVPVFIAISIRTFGLKIPAIIIAALLSSYIIYINMDWLFSGLF